jgi:hypothetical protein
MVAEDEKMVGDDLHPPTKCEKAQENKRKCEK